MAAASISVVAAAALSFVQGFDFLAARVHFLISWHSVGDSVAFIAPPTGLADVKSRSLTSMKI